MAQLKFIVVLWGLWGETKQLLLFVYATQQHMSTGPSMALGGLGSAWSLKVAAVWTNLPVSHVTPSVSLGMWEDSAHPSSCHTVSVLFCKKLLCHCCLKKADLLPWASRVDDYIFFFAFRIRSHSPFYFLVQKGQLCLIISSLLLTCLFSKLFFFFFGPYSLAQY